MSERQQMLGDELAREESRLAELDAQGSRVRARIAEISEELAALNGKEKPVASSSVARGPGVPRTSSEKVALFRKLFHGRLDVFPRRWENAKSGRAGYSPACGNEWVRGMCDKPRVKCSECPHQSFLPVNDGMILNHFHGRHVAGVYPLLKDETCWFLAVDFDKGSWQEDVAAFSETCRALGVDAAVERSRSGNGAHVWFFFGAPVRASIARQMGCYLVTETMSRRHELSMDSYDRLFPNQDTMPSGGFGNLIALPFQDGPRQEGNSVFIDLSWVPYDDQWAFLASLPRIDPMRVENLAREATERGSVVGVAMDDPAGEEEREAPWLRSPSRRSPKPIIAGPFPDKVSAVLGQQLFVEKAGLSSGLLNQMKRLAAFQNPEFYKKQAMRLSTALTPRVISCAVDFPEHIGLPRGCACDLEELLRSCDVELEIEDKRYRGECLDVQFNGTLTPIQEDAAQALLSHDMGIFVAPPGTGKTVVGAYLVARRRCSTLVLVHRTQLLEQWRAQLAAFLDLDPKEVGQVGGGKRKPNGHLDVAMIQSLVRRDEVDDIVTGYGQVIVDECHHVSAVSFERVLREVKAKYVVGLTATPLRRDGHHPILQLQLGPVRFEIDARDPSTGHSFEHRLIVRETDFRMVDGEGGGVQEIYGKLAMDEKRNDLILEDVIQALEEGRSPILLTERREHLEMFAERLRAVTRNLVILRGGMGKKQRSAVAEQLANIPENEERIVLATGRFIGEGFDDVRLDTLFLTMPVSWKGTLVQYAGRLHRRHHAKQDVRVFDYVDQHVPMLLRMFDRRMRGYRAMGYVLGDSPPSSGSSGDEYVIEYDQEALSSLDGEPI